MGGPLSCTLANLFLAHLEKHWMNPSNEQLPEHENMGSVKYPTVLEDLLSTKTDTSASTDEDLMEEEHTLQDTDFLSVRQLSKQREAISERYDAASIISGPPEVRISHGVSLVIVNKLFWDLKHRTTDHRYVEKFCNILEECNIHVTLKEDRTAEEMWQDILEFDTSSARDQNSIVFVVLISHGSLSQICGVDGEKLLMRNITNSFSSESARRLPEEVAKVFIFQCCQQPSSTLNGKSPNDLMPVPEGNFHVEFTTLPGHYDFDSHDARRPGSVFFHELTQVMNRHIENYTLAQMFTATRKRMKNRRLRHEDQKEHIQCSQGFPSLLFDIRLQRCLPTVSDVEDGAQLAIYREHEERKELGLKSSSKQSTLCTDTEGYEMTVHPSVAHLPYFFPQFEHRNDAKPFLEEHRDTPGYFLLRRSSEEGKYTFAITYEHRTLLYMRMAVIVRDTRLAFTLVDTSREFPSVELLVSYYSRNSIPNREHHRGIYMRHAILRKEN